MFHVKRLQHEGRRMEIVKVLTSGFGENRWTKGPKGLAVLDAPVENIFHSRGARVCQNAAIAEGPGTELHPPLKPANDFASGKRSCRFDDERLAIKPPV